MSIPGNSQLAAMSRLFSSAVFREMARSGRSATFARLFSQIELERTLPEDATVGDGFDCVFSVLRRVGLRDEYIYRAALTHKILLGKHSLSTASMLTEFRVGACKADLVILNGTATVYEIKSERDSLSRLSNQIANYRKVFPCVNVIVSDSHISAVLKMVASDVGVMALSRRYSISTEREAVDQPSSICPETVLDSLRADEARSVLNALGIPAPDVPNTRLRAAMREVFLTLRPSDLHRAVVSTLKRSRNLASLNELVDRLPRSLHAAALSIQIRRCERERLVAAVSVPLTDAMRWR